ncbi:hypothetical protein [Olleya sp. R77988]|uniref:hypothetical protein n=1 Tax=Olleya sp. R77988 TaxID=3093875 RepID=UPI0037C64F29
MKKEILALLILITSCGSVKQYCPSDTYTSKGTLTYKSKKYIVRNTADTLKIRFVKIENFNLGEQYNFKIRRFYTNECLNDYSEVLQIKELEKK